MSKEITYSSDEFAFRTGAARGRRTRPIQILDPALLDVDHSLVNPAEQTSVPIFTEDAYIIHNKNVYESDLQTSIAKTDYAERGFSDTDRAGS